MITPMRSATVVGSCQAAGIATSLRRLHPDAEIKAFHIRSTNDSSRAERACEGVDLVVTQFGDGEPEPGPFAPEHLRGKAGRVVSIPVVTFTGFHPDIFLTTRPHPDTRYDLGQYGSAIAVAAYRLGFDARRAERLFNAHTYEILGFEDHFERVKREFFALTREAGFDIVPYFQAWMRDGAFMHTINHPAIRVLDTFTRLALGYEPDLGTAADAPRAMEDVLSYSVVLPVYPEFARRIGVPGNTTFRRAAKPGERSTPESREIALREFVAQTYAAMAARPRQFGGNERVDSAAEAIAGYLPRSRTVAYRRLGTQWHLPEVGKRPALSGLA